MLFFGYKPGQILHVLHVKKEDIRHNPLDVFRCQLNFRFIVDNSNEIRLEKGLKTKLMKVLFYLKCFSRLGEHRSQRERRDFVK